MKMSGNEGLSDRARAFSVENLLRSSNERNSKNGEITLWKKGVGAQLCSSQLWKEFNNVGTEMLVTKAGRRMFPPLEVCFHGLSSSSTYIMFMDIVPVGNVRYRYTHPSSQWTAMDSREIMSPLNSIYVHPESPASGQLWSSLNRVSFHEVKLTNNKNPVVRGQISLQSMHKYQPRVLVLEVPAHIDITSNNVKEYVLENNEFAMSFAFPISSFITVTAYQNPEITRLKMWNNPFAHCPQIKGENQTKDLSSNKVINDNLDSLDIFSAGIPHKTVPVKVIYHSGELGISQNTPSFTDCYCCVNV